MPSFEFRLRPRKGERRQEILARCVKQCFGGLSLSAMPEQFAQCDLEIMLLSLAEQVG